MFKNILCKEKKSPNLEPTSEQRFLYTMEIAHIWLEKENDLSQKNIILNYMMDVIRKDFKTSGGCCKTHKYSKINA
ncbi:hypothetical protein [Bacillus paranthracis]|uniref:hypothetical protein n=1 Tax=Bacillus cereus group TaxID=86661 RepID=UPI003D65415C